MALIFCDGFDHYATAQLDEKWGFTSGSPSISSSAGRNGDGLLINSTEYVRKDFTSLTGAGTTWIFGFNFRIPTAASNFSTIRICSVYDDTNRMFYMAVDGARDKLLVATDNQSRSVPVQIKDDDTWHFIECKISWDGDITAIVRVDGNEFFNSALTSNEPIDSEFNRFYLGSESGSDQHHFDDFYLLDDTGTVNNDFLGEIAIEAVLPNGAGTNSDMTPTGAATNHEATDENPPDSDTTYVVSGTLNNKDSHATGNLTTTSISDVLGVQTNLFARKESSSTRELKDVIRSGGTDYNGSVSQGLTTSYEYYATPHDTNPNTGVQFTETNFNSAEFGYEIVI
ncbi:MAG: hypothetical protein ACW99G_03235 [Candidatus Thorarchaeota archaeon]|jgi:hypothetical protein